MLMYARSAAIMLILVLSQPLPGQTLADQPTLARIGRYAASRQRAVRSQQAQAERALRALTRMQSETRAQLEPILRQRAGLAASQSVLLNQLRTLGRGEPLWRAGPFLPVSLASLRETAVELKRGELEAAQARTEAAGRLVYARTRTDGAAESTLRQAELAEYEQLIAAMQHYEQTLDHVLAELRQPSVATLHERYVAALAASDARRAAAATERQRRLEIGTNLWVALGALWLTGRVVDEMLVNERIAEFRERCEQMGGRFFDGPNPAKPGQRLIECR
jgi:hypothetical protein